MRLGDLRLPFLTANAVQHRGKTYFMAEDAEGRHLLASDGSVGGTRFVDELLVPGFPNAVDFERAVVIGDQLFYPRRDGSSEALWTVDLTQAEPQLRMVAQSQSSFFRPLRIPGGLLFADQTRVWIGDTQAQQVSVLWSARDSQLLRDFEGGPRRAFFLVANSDPSDEVAEWRVWASDGTEEATAPSAPFLSFGRFEPRLLSVRGAGAALRFINRQGQHELRRWNGRPRSQLRFIHSSRRLPSPIDIGSALVFADWTPQHGLELWRADGRPGGLRLRDRQR